MTTVHKSTKSIIPTYVMLEGAEYTDIDINRITDKRGSFQCICLTEHGPFVYRGIKDVIHSFAKSEKDFSTFQGLSDCGLSSDKEGYVDWGSIKMPYDKVREVMKFFRDVFNTHGTEAVSMWYYNIEKKDWQYILPCQFGVAGGAVKYAMNDEGEHVHVKMAKEYIKHGKDRDYQAVMDEVKAEEAELKKNGYREFGTIHSHCDFSAYHSGTDDADEFGFDGLHITVGHVNKQADETGELADVQDFAQRVIGNTLYLKLESIEDAVDMEGHTLAEFRDVDNLEDMLKKYEHRFWVERLERPAVKKYYTTKKGWHTRPQRFADGQQHLNWSDNYYDPEFGHPHGTTNYEKWAHLQENYYVQDQFDVGDLVVANFETIPYVAVVVDVHELTPEEICLSTYKDEIFEFYWVKTILHEYPILMDACNLSLAKDQQISKFPQELIDLSLDLTAAAEELEKESEEVDETLE